MRKKFKKGGRAEDGENKEYWVEESFKRQNEEVRVG